MSLFLVVALILLSSGSSSFRSVLISSPCCPVPPLSLGEGADYFSTSRQVSLSASLRFRQWASLALPYLFALPSCPTSAPTPRSGVMVRSPFP